MRPIRNASSSGGSKPIITDPAYGSSLIQVRDKLAETLQVLRSLGLIDASGVLTLPPRDTSALSLLTYRVLNNVDYSYYQGSYTMLRLNDGDLTNGMMAEGVSTSKVFIKIAFDVPCFPNRLQLWNGQFNGGFHAINSLKLYSGLVNSDADPPLFQGSGIAYQSGATEFNLSGIEFTSRLDSATLVVSTGGSSASIREIRVLGQGA